MTWDEFNVMHATVDIPTCSIESKVLAKLGRRLCEFHLDEVEGQLVLVGRASSYHVKQLAQHEVMGLTTRPIRQNRIIVASK